jgi:hypothetical protein
MVDTSTNPTKKIIAYRLTPVYPVEPGTMRTACVMSCMATGEKLSGMGGGGMFLSPKVVVDLQKGDYTFKNNPES